MAPSQSGHPAAPHQPSAVSAYGQQYGTPGAHHPHHHPHQTSPPGASSMFQDDLLSAQRSRAAYSLNTGMMSAAAASASQAFPFTGFPMHPSHDPTYGFLGELKFLCFIKCGVLCAHASKSVCFTSCVSGYYYYF